MPECWSPSSAIRPRSMAMAVARGIAGPVSTVGVIQGAERLGKFVRNANIHGQTAKATAKAVRLQARPRARMSRLGACRPAPRSPSRRASPPARSSMLSSYLMRLPADICLSRRAMGRKAAAASPRGRSRQADDAPGRPAIVLGPPEMRPRDCRFWCRPRHASQVLMDRRPRASGGEGAWAYLVSSVIRAVQCGADVVQSCSGPDAP